MNLNTLKPPRGAKRAPKRVGRGGGSGTGKTCGRGHKGQKSRSSAGPRAGFEGGQMPLARRLPKYGFASRKARYRAELRVDLLARCEAEVIDLEALRAARLIGHHVKEVKVIASGSLAKPVRVQGIAVTSGARAIIEGAGGKVE